MQVRKGVRRIGALMLTLLAANALADTPKAVEVPSPEAQAEMLDLLERTQAERKGENSRKAAATKVEFFTMVRGEN